MTNPDRSAPRAAATHPQTQNMEYLRIVRSLMNVTPTELAAQLAQGTPLSSNPQPMPTTEDISPFLRAVTAWYQARLDGADAKTPRVIASDVGQDELTQDYLTQNYLTTRARWEHLQAMDMVARLNQCAGSRVHKTSALTKQELSSGLSAHDDVPDVATYGANARRRVLLVDDASDVLVTVSAFLQSFGFDVTHASNGDAALRALADCADFELLVTDHAMPGLTGKDLAVQGCQIRPNLRALIITGYPDAQDLKNLPANVMLLAKPFRRSELAECVHLLLATAVSEAPTPTYEKRMMYSRV